VEGVEKVKKGKEEGYIGRKENAKESGWTTAKGGRKSSGLFFGDCLGGRKSLRKRPDLVRGVINQRSSNRKEKGSGGERGSLPLAESLGPEPWYGNAGLGRLGDTGERRTRRESSRLRVYLRGGRKEGPQTRLGWRAGSPRKTTGLGRCRKYIRAAGKETRKDGLYYRDNFVMSGG